jgi:hypothetical protein
MILFFVFISFAVTQNGSKDTFEHSLNPTAAPSAIASPEPSKTNKPNKPKAKPGTALSSLNKLKVKPMDSDIGYDREGEFGTAWEDVDGNGCDTRNDILARDFKKIISTDGCIIYSGVIEDLYTGKTITFTRGQTSSMAVQIDHLVSLHNAWLTGAQHISYRMRVALANDPLNLEAVDGGTNSGKSDYDASWWLPPNRSARCEFVARQISVKVEYRLWVIPSEKAAMQHVLETCPKQKAYTTNYPEQVSAGLLYIN